MFPVRRVRQGDRPQPDLAFPAPCQCFVLQFINEVRVSRVLASRHQARLQRAEPVLDLPAKRHGAQDIPRQLRQRMMRGRLAAIAEERNVVTGEHAPQRVFVTVPLPQQYCTVAVTTAAPDVPQDFARGVDGLGFRVWADGEAEMICDLRFTIYDLRFGPNRWWLIRKSEIGNRQWLRLRPVRLQVLQCRISRESIVIRVTRQGLDRHVAIGQSGYRLVTATKCLADDGPGR